MSQEAQTQQPPAKPKARRRGRSRIGETVLSRVVAVRLSEAGLRHLSALAKEAGTSLALVARPLLEGDHVVVRVPSPPLVIRAKVDAEALRELRSVGVLLNQLAKALNALAVRAPIRPDEVRGLLDLADENLRLGRAASEVVERIGRSNGNP